jgi:repressor LexA
MGGHSRHRRDDVLCFLQTYLEENGYAPTYDEIRRAVGLSSKSHVAHYLCGLEHAGLIERAKRRPRGLRLADSVPDPLLAAPDVAEPADRPLQRPNRNLG